MSFISPEKIEYLSATAISAATYLDACDVKAEDVRLDPECYLACGEALKEIFRHLEPHRHFSVLLQESPAAREVAEALDMDRRLAVSRLGYFLELSITLNRAAAA